MNKCPNCKVELLTDHSFCPKCGNDLRKKISKNQKFFKPKIETSGATGNTNKFYYSNGQDKYGPFSLEELKKEKINVKTLVWYEGLDDWREAVDVDELREIFELCPPPIETEVETSETVESDNFEFENQPATLSNYTLKKQGMFSMPFSFDGRIRRTEYGISFFVVVIVNTILNELAVEGEVPLIGLAYIPTLWFLWAQGAKRCHDIGNNGWWQIIPFYVFWLIFAPGDNFLNEYGRSPKG